MKKLKSVTIFIAFTGVILATYQGCRYPTSTGNKVSGSTTGNPMTSNVALQLTQYDLPNQNIFDLKVCLSDLAFKYYYQRNPDIYDRDRATGISRYGLVQILSNGTPLGNFSLKNGTYNQIEVSFTTAYDWNPCGFSLKIINDHGEFYSHQALNLIYKGNYVIDNSLKVMEIPMQQLASAMTEVNALEDACIVDPNRTDCKACTQDPSGPNCKTIERMIVEKNLGTIFGR